MNEEITSTLPRLSRRQVIKFFASSGAVLAAGGVPTFAQTGFTPPPRGYGQDPDLMKVYQPGDVWELTFTPAEKKAATAFADVLLPADALGPAASALRVPDFIDEWISAPYPVQRGSEPVIRKGLAWLDSEADRRYQKSFADLDSTGQAAICDAICDPAKAAPELQGAALFFRTFRSLAMGAYYATPEGWKAIGYEGNVAMVTFPGPPPEVLEQLGVEQTVQ